MSRGPGVWQRLLLDALEGVEAVNVSTAAYALRGPRPARADFVAVRRAARALAEAGKVRAVYVYLPTHDESRMTPQLVVTRPDSDIQGNTEPAGGMPPWAIRPSEVRLGVRTVADVLGVSPSTVSREQRKRTT